MPSKRNSVGAPGRKDPIPDANRSSGNSVSEQEKAALETSDQDKKPKVEQNGFAEEETDRCHSPVLGEDFSEQVGNIHDNETMLLEIQSKLKAGDSNTAIRMLEILHHHVQASADPKNRILIPYIQNLLATAQNQSHKLTRQGMKNVYKPSLLSQFWLLFFSVYGLTIFCGVMSCYLSVHYSNDTVRSLNEKLQSVFTLGCGSIIGMLGAKKLTN